MLDHELENKFIDDIDFMHKESKLISIYIFRRIFKSQGTNIDTITCIISHVINMIMIRYTVTDQTMPDGSLDVTKVSGASSEEGKDKGGGEKGKAKEIVEIVK